MNESTPQITLNVTPDFIIWLIEKLEGVQGFVVMDNAIAEQLANVTGLVSRHETGSPVTRIYTTRSWQTSCEHLAETRAQAEKERASFVPSATNCTSELNMDAITRAIDGLNAQMSRLKRLRLAKYAESHPEIVNCKAWIAQYKTVIDKLNDI